MLSFSSILHGSVFVSETHPDSFLAKGCHVVAKLLRVECISNHPQTPEQKLIIAIWKIRKQFHGKSQESVIRSTIYLTEKMIRAENCKQVKCVRLSVVEKSPSVFRNQPGPQFSSQLHVSYIYIFPAKMFSNTRTELGFFLVIFR